MALSAGDQLGPYEVLKPLGAGGMGEVYRARDPRLDREVAVKVLRSEVAADRDRLRRFEREAKTVAALNHPHILTVFDVGTHEGTHYVVTELLEGETLRGVLKRRSPTLRQVLTFAVQIARGLAAAHDKDIVHRDLKPENLFLTTDGRIKILDFGLAKLTTREAGFREGDTLGTSDEQSTSPGVILGTVAYMSPEQAQAHALDNRSDIFSFGAVLYEMLAHKHPFLRDSAPATLAAIVNDTPPDLASSGQEIPPALAGIVGRCLEKERQDRFRGTHDLALALEAVLQAPGGAAALREVEERSPYPGLSSFTERDAAVFFGREDEVEALWARVRDRNLLAVIGPSGAGKTSFVCAGIVAHRPPAWKALVMTPGAQPFRGLMRALGPELAGDSEALALLADVEEPHTAAELLSRWRRAEGEGLLVVDQLEELFTQNPPEVQERFAALLGHLASEAGLHVLLSLRDDFLIRCGERAPLAPVVQGLTLLLALKPRDLRRALEEPARERGYAFEDGALVVEMLQSVEGARGALPLLAFAVARLWEKRDRERKILTRAAYEEIGGVAGALAQHAEQTLESIGLQREPIVRELFRNLVTAQWTRAVADREQLLSLFPEPGEAARVLDQLVDARLLTSYEAVEPAPDAPAGSPGRERHVDRIEIVHESLLKAWPRLVRWQAQDEEGAVLRDQLKQAAHLWDEKGRTPDLLWTGDAFQEFQVWRRRYPGALTALEEEFGKAMAKQAARRRRRRRVVAAAVVAASLTVAAVTGVLWDRARDEARRAEAGKLLALGRSHIEDDPTAALAYARGSLALWDTYEARRFAVEVLWRGPVARVLSLEHAAEQLELEDGVRGVTESLTMSPDGHWLAAETAGGGRILVFPHDGGPPRALPLPSDAAHGALAFGPDSDFLVAPGSGQDLRFLSLPDLREIRTVTLAGRGGAGFSFVRGDTLFAYEPTLESWILHALRLPDGEPRVVADLSQDDFLPLDADPTGKEIVVCGGGDPFLTVGLLSLEPSHRLRVLGQLTERCFDMRYSPRGDRVGTTTTAPEIQIWSTADGAANPARILRAPGLGSGALVFDPLGRRVSQVGPYGTEYVWDLDEIPDARPHVVGRPGPRGYNQPVTYDPSSRWMATGSPIRPTIDFWPTSSPRRRELPFGGFADHRSLTFTPDGRWLVTCSGEEGRLWPLSAEDGSARDLGSGCGGSLALHSSGQWLVAPGFGRVIHHPFLGGPDRMLLRGHQGLWNGTVAFDRDGRRAAAIMDKVGSLEEGAVRVWTLPSGDEERHSIAHLLEPDWSMFHDMAFAPDGTLYVAGSGGVRRLRLPDEPGETVSGEVVHAAGMARLDLSRDGTLLLVAAGSSREPKAALEELLLLDLDADTSRRITTHGSQVQRARLSASGRIIVTGGADGVIRVGPASGEEPHLLLGHRGPVYGLTLSPDERWIASSSDESISIWPMPDVTQPPLHTLPHDELMAKLDALTNLRVVPDPSSPTGWSEGIGPFPGWKDVPAW